MAAYALRQSTTRKKSRKRWVRCLVLAKAQALPAGPAGGAFALRFEVETRDRLGDAHAVDVVLVDDIAGAVGQRTLSEAYPFPGRGA